MAPVASEFPILAELLSSNATWSDEVKESDPDFFERTANQEQTPKILWIGCSDSRVPESVITASMPGAIFVHRNIANQFPLKENDCGFIQDINAGSVLEYAVSDIQVEHVIVVGHTRCGGINASLEAANSLTRDAQPYPTVRSDGPLNCWLKPIVKLARDLELTNTEPNRLVLMQASVKVQVENICQADAIQGAWADGKRVYVHGWIYELETGRLTDLGISRGPIRG